MNYRHIYHAGNFADVMKHAVLALAVTHLRAKPAAFRLLDTHAGIGRYDLSADEAQRTGEYRDGIGRLFGRPCPHPALAPYLDAVQALNPDGVLRVYPGSPLLMRHLLREQDRMTLAELHPQDAQTLKQLFARDTAVAVHHMDGYQALKAHLPPPEKRGLVLTDPPFESPDEFATMTAALVRTHKRWPGGIYALWYPIKERPAVWRFHEALADSGIPRILTAELTIHPEDTHLRLNGCGMVIINPPWRLDETLAEMLPVLQERLAVSGGTSRVDWLVPEQPPGNG